MKLIATKTQVEGPFQVPKLFSFAINFVLETLAKKTRSPDTIHKKQSFNARENCSRHGWLVPILAGAEFYVLLHFKTLLVSKNILP